MTNLSITLRQNDGKPILVGQKVVGSVVLDVDSMISGTRIETAFIGEESTAVHYTTSTGKHTHHHTAHQKRPLINIFIPVDDKKIIHEGKINPGRYEMPFEVELPTGLPSSMQVMYGSSKCMIVYYVTCRILGSGFLYNYHCRRDVPVEATPLPLTLVPYNGEPVTKEVNFCCCFNVGKMALGARIDDTVLEKGERTKVYMSACNHATVRVVSVQAELVENVYWRAGGHSERKVCTISSVPFPLFASLEPKSKEEVQDSSGIDLVAIHKEIVQGTHSGQIQVPGTAYETYAGQLIQVSHTLRVAIRSTFGVDTPTVYIPVQIGPRTPHNNSNNNSSSQEATMAVEADLVVPPTTVAPAVYVPSTAALLGGSAVSPTTQPEDLFPMSLAPVELETVPSPSVDNLLLDMKHSVYDLEDVKKKLKDDAWKSVIASLTAEQFGVVIQYVDLEFDQPRMAELLAPLIPQFSCQYCVAAVRNASDWARATVVEILLPYCVDLAERKDVILAELTDWEKTVVSRTLGKCLSGAK